jgi:hypothetical protein
LLQAESCLAINKIGDAERIAASILRKNSNHTEAGDRSHVMHAARCTLHVVRDMSICTLFFPFLPASCLGSVGVGAQNRAPDVRL